MRRLQFAKGLLFTVLYLGLVTMALAQAPDVQWSRTYGGANYDYLSFFQPMGDGDGGYIAAGYYAGALWLLKIDPLGNEGRT